MQLLSCARVESFTEPFFNCSHSILLTGNWEPNWTAVGSIGRTETHHLALILYPHEIIHLGELANVKSCDSTNYTPHLRLPPTQLLIHPKPDSQGCVFQPLNTSNTGQCVWGEYSQVFCIWNPQASSLAMYLSNTSAFSQR